MPLVDIALCGRKFSVSCEAGQESRLRELADYVGGKLRELSESGLSGGEAHMLVLASLLIADELFDATEDIKRIRSRTPRDPHEFDRASAAASLDSVTRRIEELAARLERA
ncbi:MAG: cell division protein ZapA [Rhodospirillaceae bacterium]